MLDAIDLSFAISKQAFKPLRRDMLRRIFALSEMVYERKRPVIVVFEGWDAAGKGTTIRALTQQLDARGYKVLSTQAARTHEKQKPWLWRFWMNIPRYGQIAIFDRSWYGRVLVERVEGLTPMPEWIAAYEEINQFERTLADDGTVFIKFWLHISKEEQLRRFIELSMQPETAWQVAAEDWEHHRKYDEYLAAVRDMLASTSTPYAPWTAVPATDREYRQYTVFRTLIDRLEAALDVEVSTWPPADELAAEKEPPAKKPKKKAEKQDKQAGKSSKPDKPDKPDKPSKDKPEKPPKDKKKKAKKKDKQAAADGEEGAAAAPELQDEPAAAPPAVEEPAAQDAQPPSPPRRPRKKSAAA